MGSRGPKKQSRDVEIFEMPFAQEQRRRKAREAGTYIEYPLSDPEQGLLSRCREKFTRYEGELTRLVTAHAAYTIAVGAPPQGRIIRRIRQYAELYLAKREELKDVEEAVVDCMYEWKPSSVLEHEYIIAYNKKYGTAGWGKQKDEAKGYRQGDSRSKNSYFARMARQRLRRRLRRIEEKYGDTPGSVITKIRSDAVPDHMLTDRVWASTLLMSVCKQISERVKIANEEYILELQVGVKDKATRKRQRDKMHERNNLLKDLHVLGFTTTLCDPEPAPAGTSAADMIYHRPWVAEVLGKKARKNLAPGFSASHAPATAAPRSLMTPGITSGPQVKPRAPYVLPGEIGMTADDRERIKREDIAREKAKREQQAKAVTVPVLEAPVNPFDSFPDVG